MRTVSHKESSGCSNGKESQKREDIHICIADPLCFTVEKLDNLAQIVKSLPAMRETWV